MWRSSNSCAVFRLSAFSSSRSPAARLPADEDVLGHRQVPHQVQLLVDDADPKVLGRPRGRDLLFLATNSDHARIATIDPGQDLHQRRLSSAVLPDQAVDLARAQIELRILERKDTRKALGDIDHLDQELIHVELLPAARDGVGCGSLGARDGEAAGYRWRGTDSPVIDNRVTDNTFAVHTLPHVSSNRPNANRARVGDGQNQAKRSLTAH